jgi:putative transposase
MKVDLVDKHRHEYGIERIRSVLQMASSTYYEHALRRRDPNRRPLRHKRDEDLLTEFRRVHASNMDGVYGAAKVWRQLRKEGRKVARCTAPRLMRNASLRGATRGTSFVVTTQPSELAEHVFDLVERQFHPERPNQLWVADITYVSTWKGFAYVAFVVNVFSRAIVGWRVSPSLRTDLTLDALEQALCARDDVDGLIHHSDRGVQYVAFRYTERLAEAGIERSVGSRGDSYDNALAETINCLYKTEVICRTHSWRSLEEVEVRRWPPDSTETASGDPGGFGPSNWGNSKTVFTAHRV